MPRLAPGTPYLNLDLGSTGQVVRARPGTLTGYYLFNGGAATVYIKFYDKATAATSSDTPRLVIGIPAGAAANLPANVSFGAGISVRAVTGVANGDTTSPATNAAVVNIWHS